MADVKKWRPVIGVLCVVAFGILWWQQGAEGEPVSESPKSQIKINGTSGSFRTDGPSTNRPTANTTLGNLSPENVPSRNKSPGNAAARNTTAGNAAAGNTLSRNDTSGDSFPKPTSLTSFREVFSARQSRVWLTASVRVVKILTDDTKGDQHQRFLVEGRNGITVLVAHNIDLAPRVPLTKGSILEIRGRYEWNDKGGVLHWTHKYPSERRGSYPFDEAKGGWIRHNQKTYR